jgi:hypothetical protein
MHWVTLIVPDFSVLDKYRLNDTKYNFDNIYLGMNIQLTEYSNASLYEGNQDASFLMGIDSMPIIGPRSHGGIVSSVFNQDQSSSTPPYRFFGLYFQPDSTGQTVLTIKNLPDSYYAANTPSTGDVAFLYNSVQGAGTWGKITGYKNAALNPGNINAIRTLMSKLMIDLVMKIDGVGTTLRSTIQINDLAWILEKSVTIKDAVYGNLQGRTFVGPGESPDETGNVWNGRKSATDMIPGAIDMMEHLCRLQNWGEVSGNNAIAGKEYSPNAKINTASFDAILSADGHADGYGTMAPLSACCPAFQIEDKGDIKTWLKELCRTFYINRSQDNIGAECVVDCSGPGPGETVTPAVAISFADVNGTIGNIEEPDPRYIYCEPVIEYAYDYGAGKFGAVLGIVDATVSYATFAQKPNAYLAGFQAADMVASGTFGTYASVGDYIWQQCNLLYRNYGNITTAPGELTDKKLISTYADALWYLRKWLWWMLTHQRRITVPTWYAKGAVGGVPVLPGTLVSVALPHLNEETPTLCRVETISRSLQKNLTQWGLIIIDEAVTIA